MLLINIYIQVFVWPYVFSSLGYIPRSGKAGSYDNFMFIFWGILKLSQNDCTILHSQRQHKRLQFLPNLINICYCLIFVIWVGEKCYLIVILRTTDVDHLLTCLLAIWISSLKKYHSSALPTWKWVYLFVHFKIV